MGPAGAAAAAAAVGWTGGRWSVAFGGLILPAREEYLALRDDSGNRAHEALHHALAISLQHNLDQYGHGLESNEHVRA